MSQFVVANNVQTTLADPATATATTLTLSSSTNLPTLGTGQIMPLTLNDAATRSIYETVYVTAISGAVLTVLRGQEGTTAQSWLAGDFAFTGPTAGTLTELIDGTQAAGSVLTIAASPMTYTPTQKGDVYLEGGTFTAITLTRAGTAYNLDPTTKTIHLSASDTLTLTYSTAPTALSFIPS